MNTVEISDDIWESWQKTADLMAQLLNVPSAIITRVDPPKIEIVKASSGEQNPYKEGLVVNLKGLYCEKVINTGKYMLLPDARKDKEWENAPEIDHEMYSYLGFPIRKPDGEIFGTICIMDNKENHFSELHQSLIQQFRQTVELQLKTQYEMLAVQKANQFRERLISIISHDLRSPFNGLLGFSNILANQFDQLPEAKKKKYVSMIQINAENTYELVENLFSWTIMNADRMAVRPVTINLNELVQENVNIFKPYADYKGISVHMNFPDNININADSNILRSVLRNLISNAIKYTDKDGQVFIGARMNKDEIEVYVKDTGQGMDQEMIRKIKEMEHIEQAPEINRNKSAGLGLSMVCQLIKEHKGAFDITSASNYGTEFRFTLPQ